MKPTAHCGVGSQNYKGIVEDPYALTEQVPSGTRVLHIAVNPQSISWLQDHIKKLL